MTCAIKKGDEFLCGSSTTLPRWGRLDTMSALITFASAADAHDFMDKCSTMEFDDDCKAVKLEFEQ